jgi:hypothetical protein
MRGIAIAAGLLLGVAGTPATASTIVQTDNEFNYSGFDGFDTSLGTLTSVTLDISVWRPRAWLMNMPADGPTTAAVDWTVDGNWVLPGSEATGWQDVVLALVGSGTSNVNLQYYEDGQAYGIFGVSGQGHATLSLDLAAFLGGHIFFNGRDPGFYGDVGDTTLITAGSGGFMHLPNACPNGDDAQEDAEDGCGSANYTLTYNYTPAVPEPGTWAMMLVGFAGVGMALRRSRRAGLLAAV